MMITYAVGARIRIYAHPDCPDETPAVDGVVLSVDDMRKAWGLSGEAGVSYVVRVSPEDASDDGLREVCGDQIESAL